MKSLNGRIISFIFFSIFSSLAFAQKEKLVATEEKGISIQQFVDNIAAERGKSVRIETPLLAKKIIDVRNKGTTLDILNEKSYIYKFDWYEFGGILSVDDKTALKNKIITLEIISNKKMKNMIDSNFLYKGTFEVNALKDTQSLLISGSDSFISDVYRFVSMIEDSAKKNIESNYEVAVIPLRYVSLYDQEISINSTGGELSYIKKGAITLIEELMGTSAYNIDVAGNISENSELSTSSNVVALSEINSVLIKDLPRNVSVIKSIIRAIDKKSSIINYKVDVFDVSDSNYNKFNSNFELAGISFNNGSFYYDSILSGEDFSIFIEAMKNNNVVESAYATSILTLENMPASFGSSVEVYVPLSSKNAPTLEKVVADNTLYITGRINANDEILTTLVYTEQSVTAEEDGDSKPALPTVAGNSIKNTFRLHNGETIILGGMEKKTKVVNESRTPILSAIPLIGFLFTREEFFEKRSKRYIAITATQFEN